MFVKQDYAINADYNIGDLSTNHSLLLNGKPIEGKTYLGDETTIHVDSDTNVISVKDGGITSDKLADGAVTADKIAEGAVVANISDSSIERNKLSNNLKFYNKNWPLGGYFINEPVYIVQTHRYTFNFYEESTSEKIGQCTYIFKLYSDCGLELSLYAVNDTKNITGAGDPNPLRCKN